MSVSGGTATGATEIRIAMRPDPIWEWLDEFGTVADWEASDNIRIEASFPFDILTAFAGGHADVVVMNALDIDAMTRARDRAPVIIGRHTLDRSLLMVARSSKAEDLGDLADKRIAVDTALDSLLLWSVIADSVYGLDLTPESDDFQIVTAEPAAVADLVVRGDVDACICLPEFSIPYLASGRLQPLYDGEPAAYVYSELVEGNSSGAPIADALVADRSWVEQNPDAVRSLLSLWSQGLARWTLAADQVISYYPHHFAVSDDAEIEWMTEYARQNSWYFPTTSVSEQQASLHSGVLQRLREIGIVAEEAIEPFYGVGLDSVETSAPVVTGASGLPAGG